MSKRKNSNDSLTLPSSGKPSEIIHFNIKKKTLVQIIILILVLLVALGCSAQNSTKRVLCNDGFQSSSGWISAEGTQSYWVVDDNGKLMEFNKQKCSIKN